MGQRIEIATADGTAEAYLTGEEGSPGVLFYADAIGLRPQIEEMTDRIASWGYAVLAPHMFYREGSAASLAPSGSLRTDQALGAFFASGVMERVAQLKSALCARDAEAWVRTLGAFAAGPLIGTVGYCMGARLALRTAGDHADVVAAAAGFHGGGLVTNDCDSPHLSVAHSTAQYAFGHADKDRSMTSDDIASLGQALEATGRSHLNEVYPGAAHGYSMADTSTYNETASERHFRTLQELLEENLRGV